MAFFEGMSIIETLTGLINCGSEFDCETLQKMLLSDQECAVDMSVCEALKQAIKQDADGNLFLDMPISLRVNEIHLKGENPIVLEDSVWDDERFPVTSIQVGATQPASLIAYKGGLVLSFSSTSDNSCYFIWQAPHEWKEGSGIEVHIHWAISDDGSGLGAENVKWDLTYSISDIDTAIPDETTKSLTIDVQDRISEWHYVDDIIEIDMEGHKISNCIIFSLTRDVSVANDYADEAYLIEIDVHYQKDSVGSKEEYIK